MIIGAALKRLFEGATADVSVLDKNGDISTEAVDIQFHYGDHSELIKWAVDKKGDVKYPLVWYVVAPYTEEPKRI